MTTVEGEMPGDDYKAAEVVTDAELVRQVLAGDEGSFATLYQRHEPTLSRRLHRILGDLGEVEDVVQNTFVTVYRRLSTFQQERSFGAWLHGIAFRVTANHLRAARRRAWWRPSASPDLAGFGDPRAPTPEEGAIRRQLAAMLYRALDRLPPRKRIAFALHDLEGLGFAEIGRLLDVAPQTVRARVVSARAALQKHLARVDVSRVTGRGVAEEPR